PCKHGGSDYIGRARLERTLDRGPVDDRDRRTAQRVRNSGAAARRGLIPAAPRPETAPGVDQSFRKNVTTLPRTVACSPGMGLDAGLCGRSQTPVESLRNVLTVASPSIIAATISPLSATFW